MINPLSVLVLVVASSVGASQVHADAKPASRVRTLSIEIQTTPPGASIYLDGGTASIGDTPLTAKLPVGSHRIIARRAGFREFDGVVTVDAKHRSVLLPMIAHRPARLSIVGPAGHKIDGGATVMVDGLVVTATDGEVELAPGRHLLEVNRERFEPIRIWVTAREGERLTIVAAPKPAARAAPTAGSLATISIRGAGPGAKLFVDGIHVPGKLPMVLSDIKPGKYRIEVRRDDATLWSQALAVSSGASIEVDPASGDPAMVARAAAPVAAPTAATPTIAPTAATSTGAPTAATPTIAPTAAPTSKAATPPTESTAAVPPEKAAAPAKAATPAASATPVDAAVDALTEDAMNESAPLPTEKVTVRNGTRVTPVAKVTPIAKVTPAASLTPEVEDPDEMPAPSRVLTSPTPVAAMPAEPTVASTLASHTSDGSSRPVASTASPTEGVGATLVPADVEPRLARGARANQPGQLSAQAGVGLPHLLDVRGQLGVWSSGDRGVAVTLGGRTSGAFNEVVIGGRVQLRDRAGLVVAATTEVALGTGAAGRRTFSAAAGAVASYDLGAHVAVSARGYLELWSDRLCASPDKADEDGLPEVGPSVCTRDATEMQLVRASDVVGTTARTPLDLQERDLGVRLYLGANVEYEFLPRHGAFASFDLAPAQGERAAYTDLFNRAQPSSDLGWRAQLGYMTSF